MSTEVLVIIFTIIIGLIIGSLVYLSKSKSRGDLVLLSGEMGSGKTTLFCQLRENKFCQTITSMKSNNSKFIPRGLHNNELAKDITYCDVPGHGRSLPEFEEKLPNVNTIIHVIDASNEVVFMNTSQRLYKLYSDSTLVKRRVPIIIAVNKMDKSNALPVNKVQENIEMSLEKIRKTKENTVELDNIGGKSNVSIVPITKAHKFTFSQASLPTYVVNISSKTGSVGELTSQLNKIL